MILCFLVQGVRKHNPQFMLGGRARRAIGVAAAAVVGACVVYRPIFLGKVLAGRDLFRLALPDAAFLQDCLTRGELPLWLPYERLGQPFAATLPTQAFYPLRILPVAAFGYIWALTVEQLLHSVIAFVGTYALCRKLRCSFPGAVFGGACFAFSHLFSTLSTQPNVVSAASWTGFFLCACLALAEAPSAGRAARACLPLGLSLLAGSPETTLWQLFLGALVVAAAPRPLRSVPWLLASLAGAFSLAALVLLPGLELAAHSLRKHALADALNWSTSLPQLLAMALPNADKPAQAYLGSGDQFFVLSVFVGALPCGFAVLSVRKSPQILALAAGALILGLLSLGSHFPPAAWLLTRSPLAHFRFPAKYLVGLAFCVAVLSAAGVDRLAVLARRRPRPLYLGLAGALVLALLLGREPLTHALALREGVAGGLLWLALFGGVTAAAFLAWPGGPGRGPRVRRVLVTIAAFELLSAQLLLDPLAAVPAERLAQPSRLGALLPRPFEGRVSVELSAWAAGSGHELKAVPFIERSRDALIPNRFIEERLPAVEGYGAPEPERIDAFLERGGRGAYDLSGVSHYLRWDGPPFPDLDRVSAPSHDLPGLYRSTSALPRAFVVHQSEVVGDEEALRALEDPGQPFRKRAFLASGETLQGEDSGSSGARIIEEGPTSLVLDVQADAEGYLVVSDAYYPGWKAQVDGIDTPLSRADFALRAVKIPPGPHRVRMHYRPSSFVLGAMVSASSLCAIILALALEQRSKRRGGSRAGARAA